MINGMKNTLLLIIISIMLFSCKKDTLSLYSAWKGPQISGYAKAKRNGQDWEGSALWKYAAGDSTKVFLIVNTFDIQDQDTIVIEELSIYYIPKKAGNNSLTDFDEGKLKLLPTATYGLGIDDQIDAIWLTNTKYNNTADVTSYDDISRTLKGHFNLVFKKSLDGRAEDREGSFPSKVSFTEGTFEARYGGPQ
jgi:hypothetical protein